MGQKRRVGTYMEKPHTETQQVHQKWGVGVYTEVGAYLAQYGNTHTTHNTCTHARTHARTHTGTHTQFKVHVHLHTISQKPHVQTYIRTHTHLDIHT